jgi:hypothetical protein
LAYISLFTDYRPNIGLGKISVSVANMTIQLYRYRPATFIGIGIGWTHISLSLQNVQNKLMLNLDLKDRASEITLD